MAKEKVNPEMEIIKRDPYNYICNFVEELYPKIGDTTFRVLALMPPSLIIPDLSFKTKSIRSNINALFLAPSGSGKTSVAKLFSNLTYVPLEFESITSPKLESVLAQNPIFSLVVGDFARMSRDPILMKTVEGVIGEEKRISRKTMRKDIETQTEGILLACGVASDLSHYIMSGFIWRVVPILISHTHEDHSAIGRHITSQIGEDGGESNEETVKEFYMELAEIQTGQHKEIEKVTGYKIKPDFRSRAHEAWEKLTKPMVKDSGLNFFRQLQEFYRFLVSHAFLNVFNRNVKDGILEPNEEDFQVALKLMEQTILFNFRLIRSDGFAKGMRSIKDFKNLMQSDKIDPAYKKIISQLVNVKGDRVAYKSPK